MRRFLAVLAASLLAGCAASPEMQADRGNAVCPSRYSLACDVSARTREIVPGTCSCVRTSDLNSQFRSSAYCSGRAFRSRIR